MASQKTWPACRTTSTLCRPQHPSSRDAALSHGALTEPLCFTSPGHHVPSNSLPAEIEFDAVGISVCHAPEDTVTLCSCGRPQRLCGTPATHTPMHVVSCCLPGAGHGRASKGPASCDLRGAADLCTEGEHPGSGRLCGSPAECCGCRNPRGQSACPKG